MTDKIAYREVTWYVVPDRFVMDRDRALKMLIDDLYEQVKREDLNNVQVTFSESLGTHWNLDDTEPHELCTITYRALRLS